MPKLGLGLYKSLLNSNNFDFARQAGATHLVVQLVDYMKGGNNPSLTENNLNGWGTTNNQGKLWEYDELIRLKKEILPVAEENGVKMVAHPDDPPMPELRNSARLFYSISEYEKLLEISDSPSNGFEFCMGTLQGKVPNYREVFVDEGDLDMAAAIRILKKNDYDGVLIPDHSPAMTCDAPWQTPAWPMPWGIRKP